MSIIIKEVHSNCTITGNRSHPRSGAFEVEIDGELVFSKFKTSNFPTQEEIKNWFT